MAEKLTQEQIIEQIASHYKAIIQLVGEDVDREGLVKTPVRAAKALLENMRGYWQKPQALATAALFDNPGSEIVIVKDIEFHSLCEHHILPFYGTVTVGYMPQDKIVGLSKVGRIVDAYSRRLQVQERFTAQVCDTIRDTLSPAGVIVVAKATHLCMKMRGVSKQQATTVTMKYCGEFEDVNRRREFFELLNR